MAVVPGPPIESNPDLTQIRLRLALEASWASRNLKTDFSFL